MSYERQERLRVLFTQAYRVGPSVWNESLKEPLFCERSGLILSRVQELQYNKSDEP